jgi:hypothetical protein
MVYFKKLSIEGNPALRAFHTRKQGLGCDLSPKTENNFRKPKGKCFKKLSTEGNVALRTAGARKQGLGFDLSAKTGE